MKVWSFLIFLILGLNSIAQIQGVVVDSNTLEGIPFVNIWVLNENIGTTSDENGQFELPNVSNGKKIVLSSIGYETSEVQCTKNLDTIKLEANTQELSEVIVSPRYNTKEVRVGNIKKGKVTNYHACNKPRMTGRYIPYDSSYQETPFIKELTFLTLCRIETATFNVRIYLPDENGYPGEYLYTDNLLVSVKKGKRKTRVDLEKCNLKIPESGIFIVVEWLIVEENKYQVDIKNQEGEIIIGTSYEPIFGTMSASEFNLDWEYNKGVWHSRKSLNGVDSKGIKSTFNPLVIELVLSN